MGLSTTTTIFLFIVCLCGGIVIGALLSKIKKNTAENPTPVEPVDEVKIPAPVPAPTPLAAPKSLADKNDIEILRAWRDVNGKVWIEMDETRFENKDAMNPDQHRRLLNMVLELRPWLDATQVPAPRPRVQEPPRQVKTASRPSLFAPIQVKTDNPEEEKPKVNLKSIVEQIDDVLQEKLIATVFVKQDIHLLDGPNGTVLVRIDDDKFDGIDAVPNPEIKALIRQAIADWEKGSN